MNLDTSNRLVKAGTVPRDLTRGIYIIGYNYESHEVICPFDPSVTEGASIAGVSTTNSKETKHFHIIKN